MVSKKRHAHYKYLQIACLQSVFIFCVTTLVWAAPGEKTDPVCNTLAVAQSVVGMRDTIQEEWSRDAAKIDTLVRDAQIGKGECYPKAGDIVSAREGDEMYILTRVPDAFLHREGLEVWIHTDVKNPQWNDEIKMHKLSPHPDDDRFIGKIRLERQGVVQYVCRWRIKENEKIVDEGWSRNRGKNGVFLVRGREDCSTVPKEDREILREVFHTQLQRFGLNPRQHEGALYYGPLIDLLQHRRDLILEENFLPEKSYDKLNRYLFNQDKPSLPQRFEDALSLHFFLLLRMECEAITRGVYREPTSEQQEAVREASALLSEFYNTTIDLSPLVMWIDYKASHAVDAVSGSAFTMFEHILVSSDEHDKARLRAVLVHEFLHLYEEINNLAYPHGFQEAMVDYLTKVLTQDDTLTHGDYAEGIRAISVLVDELGFKCVYEFFHYGKREPFESALGKYGKDVFRIIQKDLFCKDDVMAAYNPHASCTEELANDVAVLLANREDTQYLEKVGKYFRGKEKYDEMQETDRFRNLLGKNILPDEEHFDFIRDTFAILQARFALRKEARNTAHPLPVLGVQLKKVKTEWKHMRVGHAAVDENFIDNTETPAYNIHLPLLQAA